MARDLFHPDDVMYIELLSHDLRKSSDARNTKWQTLGEMIRIHLLLWNQIQAKLRRYYRNKRIKMCN